MAQKQYHRSGSIAGFHSAYIEDTIPRIAQLQPPFALGFRTTYITPQKSASSLFGGCEGLTRNILGPVLLMNNSREALDQAKQVSCNGQRHGDGQHHGGIRSRDMSGYVETKEFGWKIYKVKEKTQGNSRTFMWNFLGDLYFFPDQHQFDMFSKHVHQACTESPQVKPLLHVEVEASRVFLIVEMCSCRTIVTRFRSGL